jgi:hypothetical protein
MPRRSRAIVLRPRSPPGPEVVVAERRLAALVAEVIALDDEVERLARELSAFEARWRNATGEAVAELERAQRLLRRVERLAAEVARLAAAIAAGPPPRGARRASRAARGAARHVRPLRTGEASGPVAEAEAAADDVETLDAGELDLKSLYRRLARTLHPDLVHVDAPERARRSDLMARVNDAYSRGDRAALELLAERVGAGEGHAELSVDERLAHLARRIAVVDEARARLAAERARLAGSAVARLRDDAKLREAEGGDLLGEASEAARRDTVACREAALRCLEGLSTSAARLGGMGRRRHLESPLVRRPVTASDQRPPGVAPARALAAWLEAQARVEPWAAALVLLAFVGELAGRPPSALSVPSALAERWDALRAGWQGSPDLSRALASLPRHVEVGLRRHRDGVQAGLQLAAPDLAAGVRAALSTEPVAALTQRVLAALGPRERCGRCRADVYAVHLLRMRRLDEVHGLACPECGAVLRSFWRYGEPEGLEALAPLAVEVGLVVELPVRLGGAALAFQMLPAERARLTARSLIRHFEELCAAPYGIALARGALTLRAGGAPLAPGARVPDDVALSFAPSARAGLAARDLLALVRRGVARRFRD